MQPSGVRPDPLRTRVLLSVCVPVLDLRVGDFVDFGPKAVPPRIWCVRAIRDGLTRAIMWTPAIHGMGRRDWTGRYERDQVLQRVPDIVFRRLRVLP